MKQMKGPWTKSEGARVLISVLKLTPLCQPEVGVFPEHRFPHL